MSKSEFCGCGQNKTGLGASPESFFFIFIFVFALIGQGGGTGLVLKRTMYDTSGRIASFGRKGETDERTHVAYLQLRTVGVFGCQSLWRLCMLYKNVE